MEGKLGVDAVGGSYTDPDPKEIDFAIRDPELCFALVAPVGAQTAAVAEELSELLRHEFKYNVLSLHVIELIYKLNRWKHLASKHPEGSFDYYMEHMDAGNNFSGAVKRKDALALFIAAEILRRRGGQDPKPMRRTAHIIRSLKRPEEVRTLRNIYGAALYVIAAYASPEDRKEALAERVADARGGRRPDHYSEAEELIARDRNEVEEEYGQRLSQTFPEADVFIDASDRVKLREGLGRFLDLMFGHPFLTPTHDEYCQFLAHAASLRSSDLSRQVGAVIATTDGQVVATGANEVPKVAGGQVFMPLTPDPRDFNLEADPSSEMKIRAVRQILRRLRESGLLTEEQCDHLEKAAEASSERILKDTELGAVGEFGRSVHAEMAAISDSARRGVSVEGCELYTTTFPCHVCARHIVAAGISRVVYIEPYPKSLAHELHMDAIGVEQPNQFPHRVAFQPFLGVSPRKYSELFRADRTMRFAAGRPARWRREQDRNPRSAGHPVSYIRQEKNARLLLLEALKEAVLDIVEGEEV